MDTAELQIVIPTIDPMGRVLSLLADLASQVRGDGGGSALFTVTVVNDGASQSGVTPSKYPFPVSVMFNDNRIGAAGSRNAGTRGSQSPWIAFLDDDIRLTRSWLKDITREIRSPHAPDMFGSEIGSTRRANWFAQASEDFIIRNRRYSEGWYLVSAQLFIRRSAFDVLGGFDAERFAAGSEDWDLCRRAHACHLRVDSLPRVLCLHENPTSWGDFMRRASAYGHTSGSLKIPAASRAHSEDAERIALTATPAFHRQEDLSKLSTSSAAVGSLLALRIAKWPIAEYRLLRGRGRSRLRSVRSVGLYVPWMAAYLLASRKEN